MHVIPKLPIISLKNQREFDFVNKIGKKRYTSNAIVIVARSLPASSPNLPGTLALGMKVSRKISKKAVIRNKIRRRIRHLSRILVTKTPVESLSIIVVPRKGFESADFGLIEEEFKNIPEFSSDKNRTHKPAHVRRIVKTAN